MVLFSCSERYSNYVLPTNNAEIVLEQVKGYEDINEALEDYPKSQRLIIQKLKILKKNNWSKASESVIKTLIVSSQQNLFVYQLAAEYYLANDNIEEALKLTSSAEELGAKEASFYELKSLIYSRLEKYTEAIDYINKAILLNRSDYKSYQTKGRIYLNLADTISAIKYMKLGLTHDQNNFLLLYEISNLFEKTKQYNEAEILILEAMSFAPNEEKLKLKYSEILLGQNKEAEARTILKASFYTDSLSLKSGLMLSDLYFKSKYYDSVLLISDRILSIDSTSLFALRNKAQSFHKKGYYNSSIINYKLILSQDSLFENAKEELEKVLANRAYLQKIKDRRAAMPVFDIVAPKKKINKLNNE